MEWLPWPAGLIIEVFWAPRMQGVLASEVDPEATFDAACSLVSV